MVSLKTVSRALFKRIISQVIRIRQAFVCLLESVSISFQDKSSPIDCQKDRIYICTRTVMEAILYRRARDRAFSMDDSLITSNDLLSA